jgi:hypothetical protein
VWDRYRTDMMYRTNIGDDMSDGVKECEGDGCGICFTPNSHNQKYADPRCRKEQEYNIVCSYRREQNDFGVPIDPMDELEITNEVELKLAYTRLVKEYEKVKTKKDDLSASVYRAVVDNAENYVVPPTTPPRSDRRSKGEEVAVAVLADWQLAKVTPDYDSATCESRIDKFAEKVVSLTEIQRADHPVKDIHIWMLGDIVEGELIFPGQSFLVDGGLYRQVTVDGPRIMTKFFKKMLENFRHVYVTGVIGNHGAIGGRQRRDHDPETNADRMIYRIMDLVFQDEDRITFDIPDGRGEGHWYAIDDIGNYSSLLCHGDQFNSLSSFYQFQKKIYGWRVGAIQKHFDDVYIGHFHTPTKMTFNTIQCRISGSPESSNDYAAERLAAVGRPSQPLMFVHPERGIVTSEYCVWLDD